MYRQTVKLFTFLKTIVLILGLFPFWAIAKDIDPIGNISGVITTSDGKPIEGVSIVVKGTSKNAVTDETGTFILTGINEGRQELELNLSGFKTQTEIVTVIKNKNIKVNIQLAMSSSQLDEIIVESRRNKFVEKSSAYVSKMPLSNLENPQVYNVVSKDLMKEQVIVSFDDALKNAPGVNRLWSSTGRPGDGAGYFSMRGFSVQPTMVNGVPGLTNGGIDPANVERVEVIKGPSGTLFGSSLISFGGLINIVTKKPYETFGGELGYTFGSYGLSRVTADINTPLNTDKSALFRVNAAYHSEGSFMDAGFKKTYFFAPSFSYKVSDRLSFLINTEFYSGESTNSTMIFLNRSRQLIARTPQELHMDFNRSYTSNDISYKTPTVNIYGQMNYKISNNWTSQTNVARSVRKSDGYYSYIMFLDGSANGPIAANDTLISRYVYYQNSTTTTTDVQQNFIGDFPIGKFRNRVIAGVDVMNIQTVNQNPSNYLFDYVNVTNNADPRYNELSRAAVDAKATTGSPIRNKTNNYTYSAYVSDVFNFSEKLIAMASVRYDHFENKPTINYNTNVQSGSYNQNAFSPKFGFVYQVLENRLSVFANYMNGFRNVAPVATNVQAGYPVNLKPQQANQLEAGFKMDIFKDKLFFTASYYDILVKNITRSITVNVDNGNGGTTAINATIQDGEQKSKGLEFDLTANPIDGLNMIVGYSYNDSKIQKAAPSTNGRRPTSAGPENLGNLWIGYTVPKGVLKGFGLGFGGNCASKNYITSSLETGDFILPSYTILNGSVFYNAKKFRLAIKADNFTNKEYFGGWTTVEKQMPRRFSANLTFKF
ncbi:MAG: TonB-dependent siderophore receptor [Pseudopedobacter saltans]|uniref:TonB-dependent siderophore receptor n=1 Tax=Pseudopedobacter saltans TaxID=151895 RepID=A0A2W5F7S1_9SPHI|nr:MAG: TonB-dependent siderophore receptor [Pseudopedobacter saltans]